jgi:hypothetical protein
MKRNCVLPLCLGVVFACVPAKPQEGTQTTLDDLVHTSLDRNREVLALRQWVAQARGLAGQAGVHPAPSIEAEGLSGTPLGPRNRRAALPCHAATGSANAPGQP